jgi:uncharacterized membrane protein
MNCRALAGKREEWLWQKIFVAFYKLVFSSSIENKKIKNVWMLSYFFHFWMEQNLMMSNSNNTFVFTKENYRLMILGLVVVFLGYLLMVGGASDDPTKFNPAIFDAQRLTVAPILIIIGFIIEIFAIMKKPKQEA